MADVITITRTSVVEGLEALVEEYGKDFVYWRGTGAGSPCVYVRNGEPSCMIGKFLAAVGVPLERLEQADLDGGVPANTLLTELVDERVIDAETGVETMLGDAQYDQDLGLTWQDALVAAVEAARRI